VRGWGDKEMMQQQATSIRLFDCSTVRLLDFHRYRFDLDLVDRNALSSLTFDAFVMRKS
jgi:hypothetical protein